VSVRPFRSYRELATPQGDSITMEFGTDSETLNALMREGAIKEVEVRKLTEKHRIPMSAASALTWALNAMRVTRPADHPLGDDTQIAFEEYKVTFERLSGNLAELRGDLSKLIDADHSGENLIRVKHGRRDVGVIEIDTQRLADFRDEATKMADYLRRFSSQTLNSVTWHGDVAYLVQLLEHAAGKEEAKVSFTYAGANGVAFIEEALIRVKALLLSREDSNRDAIAQVINRRRKKKREIFARFQKG
jgi:hypothetical protein